jgi:hypothetical protein
MDEELNRNYRRWRIADDIAEDDDADAAFQQVFASAVPDVAMPQAFVANTMAAVAAAAELDARRARTTRVAAIWGGLGGGLLGTYFFGGFLLSLATSALVGLLDLLIGVIVGIATGGQTGTSLWGALTGIGRAAAAFATNPAGVVAVFAIQAVAIAALVALQRVLGSDRESLK